MNTIEVNSNTLSLRFQDSVAEIPFSVSDLDEMLCFAEAFIKKQTPSGQESQSIGHFSVLKSAIKRSQHRIDTDLFCEALGGISSEMNQFIPPGYGKLESERLCMEFLQISSENLKSGQVGDLYILSSKKNDDNSVDMSMVLNPPFKGLLLSLYDGDSEVAEDEMISSVINHAIADHVRKVIAENESVDE